MGRWGNGKMGKWEDGEMGKLRVISPFLITFFVKKFLLFFQDKIIEFIRITVYSWFNNPKIALLFV
jgi:hypothetical protein